ncbi:uncharacterized protein LOC131486626 [Neofelis nebulosa]|uniref:uncharacterized protein LOC131486626 n=1 Tax=Neofelis nebulosa TaxID=61452 RepID=UPI00272B41B2|nr:uncharacterized protein LOC131486626 [Neofelis nebulosa]
MLKGVYCGDLITSQGGKGAPPPSPRQEGPNGGAGPSHLRRDSQQRPGWKQGPGEVSLAGATPRVPDGGSKAGTRGLGAASRDPPFLGPPGPLTVLEQQGPGYRPPPHLSLLTSRCPSLCLHHNPSRRSSHGASHFPLSRRQETRRTPRPAKHSTSLPTREAPPSAPRLLVDWLVQTAYLRMDVKWMKPSNHCNKPAYTSQEMRRLDRVAMLWRSLETTVFFVAMATNSYS